ncbi:MAG: hypothetical protein B7Y39_02755 [Bdellovibrio sp. 28-41-41]|nr:MAG: hypothetical protein B7Y39_02755 [Bdellovibrio sp. 28-41-41]
MSCLVLIVALLSNFKADAHFSQVPKNFFDFELQMVEHSIGVGITMKFLLVRIQKTEQAKHFPLLMSHVELIQLRAVQHDLSKFAHTPEFVEKYYPKGYSTPLSERVLKSFGKNISKEAGDLSESEVIELRDAFKQINIIDDRLLDELVNDYAKDKNLSVEMIAQLKVELYQFEHMADLLNRQIFENLYRFRKNHIKNAKLNGGVNEVLEFGRPFKLDNGDKDHWNSGDHTRDIAVSYLRSPSLISQIASVNPWTVVQTYMRHTENSPFLRDAQSYNLLNDAVVDYVENRAAIKAAEEKYLGKKTTKKNPRQCLSFYGG